MAEDRVERRLTTILAADVVGCSRLMVNAGVILVTSSPAFAYHDTVGGGAAVGGSASTLLMVNSSASCASTSSYVSSGPICRPRP